MVIENPITFIIGGGVLSYFVGFTIFVSGFFSEDFQNGLGPKMHGEHGWVIYHRNVSLVCRAMREGLQ